MLRRGLILALIALGGVILLAVSLVVSTGPASMSTDGPPSDPPISGDPPHSGDPGPALQARVLATTGSEADPHRLGGIIYSRPASLAQGQTAQFVVFVAPPGTEPGAIAQAEQYPGETVHSQAVITSRMRAQLIGSARQVEIVETGDQVRDISPDAAASWIWHVTPLQSGPIVLTVKVFNVTGQEVETLSYVDRFEVQAVSQAEGAAAVGASGALADAPPSQAVAAHPPARRPSLLLVGGAIVGLLMVATSLIGMLLMLRKQNAAPNG